MNTGLLIVAGILALAGLICLWFWKKLRDEVALMAATPTSRASDVAAAAPGSIVAVSGTIRCTAPIAGEFSKQACVFSRSEIEREEETWRDGKRETRWVTERTTERHAPFQVEDASGRVSVNAEGATVEAVQVYDQRGGSAAEAIASIGLSLLGAGNVERRYRESILAPDTPVYVLGAAIAGGAVGAPAHGAKIKEFLITYKSKEQRARSSRRTAVVMLVIAVLLFAGTLACLYGAMK
jgi:hypothetical protein